MCSPCSLLETAALVPIVINRLSAGKSESFFPGFNNMDQTDGVVAVMQSVVNVLDGIVQPSDPPSTRLQYLAVVRSVISTMREVVNRQPAVRRPERLGPQRTPGTTRHTVSLGPYVGLSAEEIAAETNSLRYGDIQDPVNDTCPITHEPFHSDTEVVSLRECSHIFSPEALRTWLASHNTCPVCRRRIGQARENGIPDLLGRLFGGLGEQAEGEVVVEYGVS